MKNKDRVKMNEQDPQKRNKNFDEVALGYTPEQAIQEAKRCLNCKKPRCVEGCPVNVNIPDFIQKIAQGEFDEAYQIIYGQNALPAICGRVCPQESQCEGKCILGIKGEPIAIGALERFAADYAMNKADKAQKEQNKDTKSNKKIAVIGSGPAGLTCAGELARNGYNVTVFEALHEAGGVLMYGIPEFRLPKKLVGQEIAKLEEMGVDIQTNVVVGRSITIDELIKQGYEAIFVGTGAGLPKFMNLPGENLNGVYSANEFLTRNNLMKAYDFPENPTPIYTGKKTAVIGGGNVAMDSARTAKRLGAEHVYIIYRRSENEMPARHAEIEHAKEEGIEFRLLTNPVEIIGDGGWVRAIKCIEMELGEPDESGRRRPVEKPGSEFILDVDTVIIAIGQSPNPLIRQTTEGLKVENWGGIIIEEDTMATSRERVYAGGDAVTGAATVISAMGAGKKAAHSIMDFLSNK
ncbi:MAG: NADPH-dependent glutamate synthase [Clostridia bacterium]|nr:NADPH-dependent glutamate synthase [Clostridia bacterium]